MFLRQSAVGREPLAVAMSGVRMGERVLQIGMDDPSVAGALAAKPGLSGESAMVVEDDDTSVRARRSIEAAGVMVTLLVHALDALPFPDGAFDAVVVHNREGLLPPQDAAKTSAILAEGGRVLRPGGRLIVLERGTPTGLTALLRSRGAAAGQSSTEQALLASGFRAVRMLADREGYRFFEGLKA